MFVLTIDQQSSTQRGDLVPDLLMTLNSQAASLGGYALPFERTVGDEVQAALTSAATTLTVVRCVLRLDGWSIGLGIGDVDTPLADNSRAASGPAFVHAREAVQRAKTKSTVAALAVNADDESRAHDVEALLVLLGAVLTRRSDLGWEVVDALGTPNTLHVTPDRQTGHNTSEHAKSDQIGHANQVPTRTQQEVANMLGITRQAVNQRLKTALWAEESAVLPLAERLLAEADATGTEQPQ